MRSSPGRRACRPRIRGSGISATGRRPNRSIRARTMRQSSALETLGTFARLDRCFCILRLQSSRKEPSGRLVKRECLVRVGGRQVSLSPFWLWMFFFRRRFQETQKFLPDPRRGVQGRVLLGPLVRPGPLGGRLPSLRPVSTAHTRTYQYWEGAFRRVNVQAENLKRKPGRGRVFRSHNAASCAGVQRTRARGRDM